MSSLINSRRIIRGGARGHFGLLSERGSSGLVRVVFLFFFSLNIPSQPSWFDLFCFRVRHDRGIGDGTSGHGEIRSDGE